MLDDDHRRRDREWSGLAVHQHPAVNVEGTASTTVRRTRGDMTASLATGRTSPQSSGSGQPEYQRANLGPLSITSRATHGMALHVEETRLASLKVGTGLDAPISNQTEGAAEVAARVAQQDAAPGKGKAAAGLASGIEKVQGFSLPKVAAARSAKEVLSDSRPPRHRGGILRVGRPRGARSVLETVHGPDDRVKITSTNVYPWRAHASLLITARDGSMWIGTGWFIGPHTLMTAGHVVYIKNSGVAGRDGFVRSIKVMPGRNGTTLPYGSVTSSNLRTVQGWANSGDEVRLRRDHPRHRPRRDHRLVRVRRLQRRHADGVGRQHLRVPGDKPDGTQWYAARRIASVGARKVHYDIDTFGGQSGSAVYRIVDGKRYAFGIHAYGATTNSGTRIVTPVYNNMVAWKA